MRATANTTAEEAALDTLCGTLDLARRLADDLPRRGDPGHAELVAALALSHLCARRLAAEAARAKAAAKAAIA